MNLSICNLDSSFFLNDLTINWAVRAIDSFCKDFTDAEIKKENLAPSTALAFYARNSFDEKKKKVLPFKKESIKEKNRKKITGAKNANTFSSWCRRSGILYDQRSLFGLSEIATFLLKPQRISTKEFIFMVLAKQWIRKDDECAMPLLSAIDILTEKGTEFVDLLGTYSQKNNNADKLQELVFETVTGQKKGPSDTISFSRFDNLRSCLVQAGIFSEKKEKFKLTKEGEAILKDFHNNDSCIGSYVISKTEDIDFYEYMCSINNGAITLINEDNVHLYDKLYPNLSRIALEYNTPITKPRINPLEAEEPQQVFYGAPGTGKSFHLEQKVKDKEVIRTIFHPDYDYASFIGCYKPISKNGRIEYIFRPQAFIHAYTKAWLSPNKVYLVIEEINRGNCAQIFGDIFQLLDRKDGESIYSIFPDSDLKEYLSSVFNCNRSKKIIKENGIDIPKDILTGEAMRLPANLILCATMNTSDQSLFPMDSAFKRRWAWKYFPIKDEKESFVIKVNETTSYDWWQTISRLNDKIYDLTKSADKQLGYWFVKAQEDKTISREAFVTKVVFYLWNDIFKDYDFVESNAFTREITFDKFFNSDGSIVEKTITAFMSYNQIEPLHTEEISSDPLIATSSTNTDNTQPAD